MTGPTPPSGAERGRSGMFVRWGDEYVITEPIGWQEEHNRAGRALFWLLGREHCNDREGQRRSRLRRSGPPTSDRSDAS